MFRDRKDAGRKLASALMKYKDKDVLVLAIPCGGVGVAYEVAKTLAAELDILVSRKLPLPENPEADFGAIAKDGSIFINQWAAQVVIFESPYFSICHNNCLLSILYYYYDLLYERIYNTVIPR